MFEFLGHLPYIYIYIYISNFRSQIIHLLNVIVQFIVFLTFSTLICRGTDLSKCFSESLGIRDNESRLYLNRRVFVMMIRRIFLKKKVLIVFLFLHKKTC